MPQWVAPQTTTVHCGCMSRQETNFSAQRPQRQRTPCLIPLPVFLSVFTQSDLGKSGTFYNVNLQLMSRKRVLCALFELHLEIKHKYICYSAVVSFQELSLEGTNLVIISQRGGNTIQGSFLNVAEGERSTEPVSDNTSPQVLRSHHASPITLFYTHTEWFQHCKMTNTTARSPIVVLNSYIVHERKVWDHLKEKVFEEIEEKLGNFSSMLLHFFRFYWPVNLYLYSSFQTEIKNFIN